MLTSTFVPEPDMIETEVEARALLRCLQNVPVVAVDTETTGLVRHKDHVVFWSMSDGHGRWCLSRAVLPYFKEFLEDKDRELVFHNVNFDRAMLLNSGIDIANGGRTNYRCMDTMIMHVLLADNQLHNLELLGKVYLGVPKVSFRETFGRAVKDTGKVLLEAYSASPQKVIDYASLDAWLTFELYRFLSESLRTINMPDWDEEDRARYGDYCCSSLWEYYCKLERPMHDVLWHMERHGCLVDVDYLQALEEPMQREIDTIAKVVARLAGRVINPNSPPQLVELFFRREGTKYLDDRDNPPVSMTPGGESGDRKPSVDEEYLQFRRENYHCPIATQLLRFRTLTKFYGTYVKGILKRLSPDGRLRTSFTQTPSTGRLSSRDPNLQNLPRVEEDQFGIRKTIVARSRSVIVDSDYDQLEMKIVASVANEPNMLEAILAGRDMHCWAAHRMFGEDYDEIYAAKEAKDNKQSLSERQKTLLVSRSLAKTTGFGVLYGEGPRKLSADLEITVKEAKEILEAYFTGYPRIRELRQELERFGHKYGYVMTPLGRRRQMAQLQSASKQAYAEGVRQAGNLPIQGHAAELTKAAQIRIFEDQALWDEGVRMILQVHDEILGEVPDELADDPVFTQRWLSHLTHPFDGEESPLRVPLTAGIGTGRNWAEAK